MSLAILAATAQGDAQDDPLVIAWKTQCMSPAGADPAVVCVPASDSRLSKLGDYSTVRVSIGDAPEARFQLLPLESGAEWGVLVDSPGTSVCEVQPASGPPVCGPVATGFRAGDCAKAAAHYSAPVMTPCTLRPTPYDNPSFPHFPNPETKTPGYFAPWPVYGTPGGMPGDLDKRFFENVEDLAGSAPDHPADVLAPAQRRQLEIMAWQEFLALNWPVDDVDGQTRLNPVTGPVAKGVCPAWAGWRRRDEVMRGTERLPIPWGINPSDDGSSGICDAYLDEGEVAMLSATGGRLGSPFKVGSAAAQPDGHLLFDRNGLLVFYDVRINRNLYDYILRKSLYRNEPPKEPIQIPHGQLWPTSGLGLLKANEDFEGPIAVKFAWKQLTGCDKQDRFILARSDVGTVGTQEAVDNMRASSCTKRAGDAPSTGPPSAEETKHLAFLNSMKLLDTDSSPATAPTPDAFKPKPDGMRCKPLCDGEECLLGLVAMHIGQKTSANPNWNWSTFVHRDALESRVGGQALFDTSGCDEEENGESRNCNECEDGRCVTRVCRTFQPTASTEMLNDEVQTMLAAARTPLFRAVSNYKLLGVQWVDQTGGEPRGAPADLLNPIMETFTTESSLNDCFSCHAQATKGDFLFFLSRNVPEQ